MKALALYILAAGFLAVIALFGWMGWRGAPLGGGLTMHASALQTVTIGQGGDTVPGVAAKLGVTAEELTSLQARARQVHVDDSLREYIVRLVQRTREQERLFLGASPRGSLALYRAAQAMAVLEGRDFVLADDVQELVLPTLGHRMLGRDGAGGRQVDEVLRSLLEQVKVPV